MSDATSFEHFRCPICFFILIEPVSLPCNHKLCLACFDKQVEEVNYTCPLCRHRISNWARMVSRENSLVDEELWTEIQSKFPLIVHEHIQSKLSLGLLSAKCVCLNTPCSCVGAIKSIQTPEKRPVAHNFARPGEISLEYQQELMKAREEFQLERLEEIKANEEFILSKLSESKRKRLKDYLQFQQAQIVTSKNESASSKAAEQAPVRSRSATGVSGAASSGDALGTIYRSPSTSSIDSITPEVQGFLFKPIHCSPRTPPRRFGQSSAQKQQPVLPALVSYPPVIRSVPRVLDGCDTSSESSFASSCSSMSNFRGGPPQKFKRRYPTRAATRRAVISMGANEGQISRLNEFASPAVDVQGPLDPHLNQSALSKGALATEDSSSMSTSPSYSTLSAADSSSVASRLAASANTQTSQTSCPSPTSTSRSGRSSSRLAAPAAGNVGSKRKQQAPDEKENKRGDETLGAVGGAHVEIPEFKKLRLNPALFTERAESAALSLSASSNKLDASFFINSRKSGVEFFDLEAYKQYLAGRDAQIKMDFKLAKELSRDTESTEGDEESGCSSPVEEKTYSLRKRKVNYRQ